MKPSYTQGSVLLASLLLATATQPLSADWVQVPLHDLKGGSALEVADGRLIIAEADAEDVYSTADGVNWKAPMTVNRTYETTGGECNNPVYWKYCPSYHMSTWTSGTFIFQWQWVTVYGTTLPYNEGDISYNGPMAKGTLGLFDSEGYEQIVRHATTVVRRRDASYFMISVYSYNDPGWGSSEKTKIYRFRDGEAAFSDMEIGISENAIQYGSNTGRYYIIDPSNTTSLCYMKDDGTKQTFLWPQLPSVSGGTSPYLIADDGANTIIFNNRAYSNDDGQTWNYYETPLPADHITYAEGVFEYTAAPSATNGLTTPVRARSTDQGKTWQSVGLTEAMPNYTMEAVWLPDSNTTKLHVTVDIDAVETFSMPNLQVLDTAVFNGSFVVLAKTVTGADAGKRSVWVYASEQSPLTTVSTTQDQMIDDGCWEVEFTDLPNVPFFKRVGHQNKSLFKLYAPTGRARNAIFGISDVSSYPWVVNADIRAHAYFKADGPTPAAFLWSPTEDWLYTAEGWYPFLWSFKHQNWIWIDAGETRTHWWFLYQGDGVWERLMVQ
ncbi:MAG: hypothetical protein SFY80_05120 [Verrucomicrobiota bacterium]|nr:hypothetical protein [Verrucomicrobiota bacterium]